MVSGGVNLPWNLAVSILIGIWLMRARLTLGAEGAMANADHLIGVLVIAVAGIACAEVARPVRFVNMGFGTALFVIPFVLQPNAVQMTASIVCGLAPIGLSVRRGPVKERYAGWEKAGARN